MRIAQLSQEFEVLARIEGVTRALVIVGQAGQEPMTPSSPTSSWNWREAGGGGSNLPTPGKWRLELAPQCVPLGDAAAARGAARPS